MGFYVMIFSMIFGLLLISYSIKKRQNLASWKYLLSSGIVLAAFSIWLGLPK